jgi:hypothetical protein
MAKQNVRLTELTPEEVSQLQCRADHLIRQDSFLSRLPLSLQAVCLAEEGFDFFQQVAFQAEWQPDNPLALRWHNMQRTQVRLAQYDIE